MPFEELRPATLNDIGGILELIKPLEQQGKLAKRSREKIEMEIADYIVIERDGLIIGCTALHPNEQEKSGVIACMAVHADYQGSARGNRMLEYAYHRASGLGLKNYSCCQHKPCTGLSSGVSCRRISIVFLTRSRRYTIRRETPKFSVKTLNRISCHDSYP